MLTSGFGIVSECSRKRVPSPPQNSTTFMAAYYPRVTVALLHFPRTEIVPIPFNGPIKPLVQRHRRTPADALSGFFDVRTARLFQPAIFDGAEPQPGSRADPVGDREGHAAHPRQPAGADSNSESAHCWRPRQANQRAHDIIDVNPIEGLQAARELHGLAIEQP